MDDSVGRAAERHQHAQRILYRFRVDELRRCELRADHLHRGGAGGFRRTQAVSVHGGDRSSAGQADAERFGEACHGRSGTHHRAGAGCYGELAFDFVDFFIINVAGAIACPELAAVRAGAEPLAAMASSHHRTRDQRDRRPVGRHRSHELRRYGLVATAHQHDRVHRLGADHLLGVDRHKIAILQAGRRQEHLAERDCWKFKRQRAGGQHATLHRGQQFGKMTVTIVEVGPGVGDANHRLIQEGARIAHRLRERAAQVAGEVAVAVIGKPAR